MISSARNALIQDFTSEPYQRREREPYYGAQSVAFANEVGDRWADLVIELDERSARAGVEQVLVAEAAQRHHVSVIGGAVGGGGDEAGVDSGEDARLGTNLHVHQ